jgi:uncharacterized YceG family protein
VRRAKIRAGRRTPYIARIAALLALAVVIGGIWFLVELFQPFAGSASGPVIVVTIPRSAGASAIGDLLAKDGVISSGFFFKLRAALEGDRDKLLAGTYRMKHGMSYSSVLTLLTTPPKAAPTTEVTIVPGRTRRQVDGLLHEQHVRGSYLGATRRSPVLSPVSYGAPRSTPSLEGFLFPDTYQVRTPISIGALVTDQLREFKQQFAGVGMGYARSRRLTPYDVLIIASMVEAEAATAHDRPLVASVIYNRLADRTPLGIDATNRYATDNYTKPLTASELNSPSPYNTRLHVGLPPTPIDSPGLAAIRAAAHPARTHDLYFVVRPCGNGEMTFTSSYSQFLADAHAYQNARAQRGGHSPEHC